MEKGPESNSTPENGKASFELPALNIESMKAAGYSEVAARIVIKYFDEIDEDEYEYNDSFRFARVGNESEEAEYRRISNDGCCGFHDEEIDTPDGKVKVGFNYGH